MRLHGFRGGVHPPDRKQLSAEQPIQPLPLPPRLYISLQQHAGGPALPVVKAGQRVAKGELLAREQGATSAPLHAPSSGTVAAIGEFAAPHVSGLPLPTLILDPDGEERWLEREPPPDPFGLDPEEVATRIGAAGIVGMGGANFPAAVKLSKARQAGVRVLAINGAECEPYVTCDDRLMRERAAEIVEGAAIMLHALQAPRAVIAIEDNKPDAIAAMRAACRRYPRMQVVSLPTRYPTGSARQLVQSLTGLEAPAEGRSTDTGVLVHNVGTAYAVQRALRHGRPLISRIVTVSGGAVVEPRNLEVPIGALAADLLARCGVGDDCARLLLGGPMMGQPLPSLRVPVVKGTNGILALTAAELGPARPPAPCVRCGRCVDACPMGLMPVEMSKRAQFDDWEGALAFGLNDCMACGSCAYVCPSRVPLLQYFAHARGALAAQRRAEQKARYTRHLLEQRQTRLERQARARVEAAAQRRAARRRGGEAAE
ncbi:MAG TPA: electron transport complex subunit RsxC [Xanthomonadaceae bacterium]|nr:electron transport complex subunit RsxC [Xanthomonadaceae bacterium]